MALAPRGNFFDIDRVFDNYWAPTTKSETPESGFFAPRVDIKELDNCYQITAELPGVKKDDIHVTLEDGVLSISAETSSEDKEEENGKVIRQERRYGKYLRSFTLGNNIHEKDISADFTDGILKLKAPKSPDEAPQKRRIEIGG
ncbi:MAG: Hsp20/alpha crystallin family protein [Gammaproteobacteria bacterium]|nr:Hsp20/alpha crystallin family protein [Gammaproteobacteria bacterium]MBQ0839733.1 Hsp20/alpha crystallin family protein [Gammaproteobacteria bacterium]